MPRGAGRPGAARSHRRSRVSGRTIAIVVAMLVVVVGGWYLFLRGGGGPPTGAFMKAESVYLEAARQVPVAAGGVHRQADVEAFDAVAIDSAIKMNNQVQVFRRLARDEEGTSAELAGDAARAGAAGVKAVAGFRDALAANKVADAVAANGKLQSSIADIEQAAKQWRRL
jgi:hypothetical protein